MGRAAVLRSTQAAALEVNSGSQVRSLFFRVQSASPLAFCCGTGFSAQGAGVGGVSLTVRVALSHPASKPSASAMSAML